VPAFGHAESVHIAQAVAGLGEAAQAVVEAAVDHMTPAVVAGHDTGSAASAAVETGAEAAQVFDAYVQIVEIVCVESEAASVGTANF